jgi:hypothetical protein
VKPYLKFVGVFVAGFIVCLALNYFTANRYSITTENSRTFKIDRVSGATWIYRTDLGQWVAVANR